MLTSLPGASRAVPPAGSPPKLGGLAWPLPCIPPTARAGPRPSGARPSDGQGAAGEADDESQQLRAALTRPRLESGDRGEGNRSMDGDVHTMFRIDRWYNEIEGSIRAGQPQRREQAIGRRRRQAVGPGTWRAARHSPAQRRRRASGRLSATDRSGCAAVRGIDAVDPALGQLVDVAPLGLGPLLVGRRLMLPLDPRGTR